MKMNSITVSSEDNDCDDEELVLEGSELHTYLKLCFPKSVDVYRHENKTEEVRTSKSLFEAKVISRENLKLVHMILNCNLLLDEDASYLFNVTSDFIPENKLFIYSKRTVILYILGAFLTVSYLYFGSIEQILLPIITGLLILFSSLALRFYDILKNKKNLGELLQVLQEIFLILRKIIKNIAEDEASITSKEFLLKLRGNEHNPMLHTLRKNMPEVLLLSSKTVSSLKHLIMASRNMSLSLMKIEKNAFCKQDLITFCSDDQLGLNLLLSDSNNNSLVVLDTLKNVYLLLQSESLRLLGVCILKSSSCDISKLFKIVSIYHKETSSTLNFLQRQYEKYFFPNFSSQGFHSLDKLSKNNNLIHDISRKCYNLLVDIRQLEDFIERNDNVSSEKICSYANFCLVDIEKEVMNLLQLIQSSKYHSLNLKPQTKLSDRKSEEERVDDSINKVNFVDIGYSDFSVNGIDEVFLGCSGSENNLQNEEVLLSQANEFKPPDSLIYELKTALIKKKEEFELRELNALKTSEEIEAYKACSNSNLISVDRKNFELNEESLNNHKSMFSKITHNTLIDHSPYLGVTQKDIALAASNLSAHWDFLKSVDYFEDDESD